MDFFNILLVFVGLLGIGYTIMGLHPDNRGTNILSIAWVINLVFLIAVAVLALPALVYILAVYPPIEF